MKARVDKSGKWKRPVVTEIVAGRPVLAAPRTTTRTTWRSTPAATPDYTNVTNVGLHLIAIVAAPRARAASPRDEARRARRAACSTRCDRLETHDGFFFNYYDTTSLERTSNFVSFVDSAWLTAGLMVVRQALPRALADRAPQLHRPQDYGFFYDPRRSA